MAANWLKWQTCAAFPALPRAGERNGRNADDPVLLAEQVKRLDGFFGQTDDPPRRKNALACQAAHALCGTVQASG
jgi:hypothetical protein